MTCQQLASAALAIALLIGSNSSADTPWRALQTEHNTNSTANTEATGSSKWCEPLGAPLHVSRLFTPPAHKYAAGHRGVDLANGAQHVYAPAAGTVTFVGLVVDRPLISVEVDDSLVYTLEPVRSDLQIGDQVSRCQLLGTLLEHGHTGPGTVHLGVRINGEYVNPLRFYRSPPRLLPLG